MAPFRKEIFNAMLILKWQVRCFIQNAVPKLHIYTLFKLCQRFHNAAT